MLFRSSWSEGLFWHSEHQPVVLTIENLTTFNIYVRRFRDSRHCIVYTGGFPSSGVMSVLKRLKASGKDTRFFHWGDMDWAGYDILQFIARELSVTVTPYLMCPSLLVTRGGATKTCSTREISIMETSGSRDGHMSIPSRELMKYQLEQEAIDPMPLGA